MIPNKINVAGIDYSVHFVDFIEIDGNRNYQGSCSYQESEISVLNNLSKNRKEQVFVHELVHAIFNEAGFDAQDEDMVNRLGIVLYQVLKDNKLSFEKS
ncbi:ImmA/IrrE family metallo-endopeptidase [Niallia taxi]|uniref:ImmA/IrrE family metallo-endopeptidase n=1 Tax=Niallia taxi TaxID=2499688 RepID=UPI002934F50B|nr:ImmA/IrrE family metallo-endopeptidase [Niallia taxi]WOD61769.1 ImmA/IrrE family metallo-endopeptidase [Niallia taxi]